MSHLPPFSVAGKCACRRSGIARLVAKPHSTMVRACEACARGEPGREFVYGESYVK
ncbi:hypothetical protein [Sporomusa sphaeroides]|uniref:hypothetical protein n=1 Tax=Sporomusa sphaeroides TaxID=47679 RepID=UPI003158F74C